MPYRWVTLRKAYLPKIPCLGRNLFDSSFSPPIVNIEDPIQFQAMRPTTSMESSVSNVVDICRRRVVVRTPRRNGVSLLNTGSPCSSMKTVLRTLSEESVRIMMCWCVVREGAGSVSGLVGSVVTAVPFNCPPRRRTF